MAWHNAEHNHDSDGRFLEAPHQQTLTHKHKHIHTRSLIGTHRLTLAHTHQHTHGERGEGLWAGVVCRSRLGTINPFSRNKPVAVVRLSWARFAARYAIQTIGQREREREAEDRPHRTDCGSLVHGSCWRWQQGSNRRGATHYYYHRETRTRTCISLAAPYALLYHHFGGPFFFLSFLALAVAPNVAFFLAVFVCVYIST